MATLTRVQHNSTNPVTTAASLTATLGSGVTSGNLLVATITVGSNVGTVTPPASWAQAGPAETNGTSLQTQIFYLVAGAGGATSFVFSWTGTHSFGWTIDEWNSSTGWQPSPVDSSAGATATSASVSCGFPAATAQASELWYGVLSWAGSGQTLSGITGGWTTGDTSAFSGNNTNTGFYQIAAAAGTPALAATISASEINAGVVATFIPAPVTAAPGIRPQIPPGRRSPMAWQRIAPQPPLPGTPTVNASVTAGLASGTGTAQSAASPAFTGLLALTGVTSTARVAASAGAGLATGTAQPPAAQVTAFAGLAAGTGAAVLLVPAFAGLASGTGTAQQPAAQVAAFAGTASGTGAAQAPATGRVPGAAAGTAAAQQPGAQVTAFPGTAAGTGTVFMPAAGLRTSAATGTAYQPAAAVTAFPGAAAGTGATAAPGGARTAGVAAGAGAGAAPLAAVSPVPGTARGTGTVQSPGFAPQLPHWGGALTSPGPSAVLTTPGFRAVLTAPGFGAALTTPRLGAVLTLASLRAVLATAGLGANLSLAGFGAVLTGGTMQQASLTLSEFNDMTISIAVTNNGSPFNLTGYNLNLLLKSQAGVPDTQALTFSSSGGSPAITITSPSGGLATAQLPNASLNSETYSFYRLDVVNASSQQQTTVYGNIIWVTL